MNKHTTFSSLVGMTLKSIKGDAGSDRLTFHTTEGRTFSLFHSQDCCESVALHDISGDLRDLLESPILIAEEVSSPEDPPGWRASDVSYTWTFYRIGTIKGMVTLRWLGESNGYYSESVDFVEEGVDSHA